MFAICDPMTGWVLAVSSDPQSGGPDLVRVPLPSNFDERDIGEWRYQDGALVRDAAAALAAIKARRVAEIRRFAAAQIAALDWRIERAEERDRLGLPGEMVTDVLLEREAIRRASNRCEAEIASAQDDAAVKAVTFAVTDADRATPLRITRLQFLSRFTDTEMQTVLGAAKSSPMLEAALLKWQTAEGIVLSDPATLAGVQALEMAGLIAPGRAAEILNPQGD
ncbi:hypothetical protein EDC62_0232 [Tibeticola sediminis]|uniref:Uncharacterized protein n=1 Tax=Tibeticola sediminis TaxID=1917811 RepID=A0A3N4UY47_9BURK|nr:hypothetical protein [Tibeticola sediminis]RPE72541.1 hypothetical protein EDC62_0232 [Tibeticola sediminis]